MKKSIKKRLLEEKLKKVMKMKEKEEKAEKEVKVMIIPQTRQILKHGKKNKRRNVKQEVVVKE